MSNFGPLPVDEFPIAPDDIAELDAVFLAHTIEERVRQVTGNLDVYANRAMSIDPTGDRFKRQSRQRLEPTLQEAWRRSNIDDDAIARAPQEVAVGGLRLLHRTLYDHAVAAPQIFAGYRAISHDADWSERLGPKVKNFSRMVEPCILLAIDPIYLGTYWRSYKDLVTAARLNGKIT